MQDAVTVKLLRSGLWPKERKTYPQITRITLILF